MNNNSRSKRKSLYFFCIGIIYILFWEAVSCFELEHRDLENERKIFRDLNSIELSNRKQQEVLSQENEKPTFSVEFLENEKVEDVGGDGGDDGGDQKHGPSTLSSFINGIKTGKLGLLPKFDLPPLNITLGVNNSNFTLPLSIIADKLNISEIYMYSPNVRLPVTLTTNVMPADISIVAENLPMTLNLEPKSQSTIPIALNIRGENSIPINLHVDTIQSPILNYVFFIIVGVFNFLFLGIIIFQQVSLNSLKKRLDTIEVSNQVLSGKRYKIGSRWYTSLDNNSNDNENDKDNNPSSSISNHCVICSNCGQTNGKTKFCFECGDSLIIPNINSNNDNNNNNNILHSHPNLNIND